MIVEIILGLAAGIGVGYLVARAFLWYNKNKIIRKAKKRIEKQELSFIIDGKNYDLKEKIKPKGQEEEVHPLIEETPVPGIDPGRPEKKKKKKKKVVKK